MLVFRVNTVQSLTLGTVRTDLESRKSGAELPMRKPDPAWNGIWIDG